MFVHQKRKSAIANFSCHVTFFCFFFLTLISGFFAITEISHKDRRLTVFAIAVPLYVQQNCMNYTYIYILINQRNTLSNVTSRSHSVQRHLFDIYLVYIVSNSSLFFRFPYASLSLHMQTLFSPYSSKSKHHTKNKLAYRSHKHTHLSKNKGAKQN